MKKLYAFVFLAALALSVSLVAAAPSFPIQFAGDVVVNGRAAPDGLLVTAKINGQDVGATQTKDGAYSMKIGDPYGNREGETVAFFVAGIDSGERAVWSYTTEDGSPTTLQTVDLSVQGDICGDGSCTSGESCTSCVSDCGACPAPSSTGSTGGGSHGGGGGYVPPDDEVEDAPCVPDWVCSDWLDCASGTQQRVCVDSNRCGDDSSRPEERRDCEVPAELRTETQDEAQDAAVEAVPEAAPETVPTSSNALTGAVIGGGAVGVTAFFVVLALIAGGFLAWRFRK